MKKTEMVKIAASEMRLKPFFFFFLSTVTYENKREINGNKLASQSHMFILVVDLNGALFALIFILKSRL